MSDYEKLMLRHAMTQTVFLATLLRLQVDTETPDWKEVATGIELLVKMTDKALDDDSAI